MHGHIFKGWSKNSAIFKMELFSTIVNGRAYKQLTVVFAYCCSNSTIFGYKIKIRWKWPCLKGGIRYIFLFCRHVSTFFWKLQFLSVLVIYCLISKTNYKIINRSNWQHMFRKMLFIKCSKNSFEGVIFLKKLKTEAKLFYYNLNFDTG